MRKDVLQQPVKSKIKFVHVRLWDNERKSISPHGGWTIAYFIDKGKETTDIFFATAYCKQADLFCYATGRDIARDRLENGMEGGLGSIDMLPLSIHPVSHILVKNLADSFFDDPVPYWRNQKGRWLTEW